MIFDALFAACVAAAAQFYGHTSEQLWLIHKAEGGAPGLERRNRDGSADLGPFQINDRSWVRYFARKLARPPAAVRSALKDDACFNAYAAGYILRLAIDDSGGNVWEGMGRYHSATPAVKIAYQRRLSALFAPHSQVPPEPVSRRRQLQNERLAAANGAQEDLVQGHAPVIQPPR